MEVDERSGVNAYHIAVFHEYVSGRPMVAFA